MIAKLSSCELAHSIFMAWGGHRFSYKKQYREAFERALKSRDPEDLPISRNQNQDMVWIERIKSDHEMWCYGDHVIRNPYHVISFRQAFDFITGLIDESGLLKLVAPEQSLPPYDPANTTITPIQMSQLDASHDHSGIKRSDVIRYLRAEACRDVPERWSPADIPRIMRVLADYLERS